MRRSVLIAVAVVAVLGVAVYATAHGPGWAAGPQRFAQMGPGMMGGGMMGGGMMGPGMMGGGMMGGGHMGSGPGGGMAPGAAGFTPPCAQFFGAAAPTAAQVTKEQVAARLQNWLTGQGNPNLKLGEVKETETQIEAQIVTKDNSLVERVIVDKRTGATSRAY